jgi:hypothetical protein
MAAAVIAAPAISHAAPPLNAFGPRPLAASGLAPLEAHQVRLAARGEDAGDAHRESECAAGGDCPLCGST